MALKKILNLHEETTHRRLRQACEEVGAAVFAKVRVADVLPIEGSGIADHLFSYALQSHFDFLVTDAGSAPLFAVEFDGPSHDSAEQQERDAEKDELCEFFELPLLRINARYLPKTYGTLDLLTWFVDVWFLERAFETAQRAGHIPPDEPFDHKWLRPAGEKGWRWHLSAEIDQSIRRLSDEGRCWDPGVSWIVGTNSAGTYRAIGYLRVTPHEGLCAKTAMRKQRFPAPIDDLLGDVLTHEIYQRLLSVLDGREFAEPVEAIKERIAKFEREHELVGATGFSRGTPLRR